MAESREAVSGELILCFALRHLGDVRELLILKVKGNNFYLFLASAIDRSRLTYTLPGTNQVSPTSITRSTASGGSRRRAVGVVHSHAGRKSAAERGRGIPDEAKQGAAFGTQERGPTPAIRSLSRSIPRTSPRQNPRGESVVLDAEAENFTDDFIAANVYLVEPGAEDRIPIFPCIAARLLHLDKRTTPWLAVELFQQAAFDGRATEALREWERQMALCSKRFGCPE